MGRAPNLVSMQKCDKKCKCTYGPYRDLAYACKKPCNEGCTFSCDQGCDCGDGSGCWLINVARSSTLEGWSNPGDVEDLYQNVPPDWDLGLWTSSTSYPSAGTNHFPVEQECTQEEVLNGTCGEGLPPSTFYRQFNGATGVCFTEERNNGSNSGGQYTLVTPGGQKGGNIFDPQGATGQGVDYCNTDTISAEIEEEIFPPNKYNPKITCRNPYAIWARILRVNGSGNNNGQYFCGDGTCGQYGFWTSTGVQFVELDYALIGSFYNPSVGTCGYTTRGGFYMEYRVSSYFEITYQDGSYSSGIFQGRLRENEDPEGTGRSVAAFFGQDVVAAKAELYIGPSDAPTPEYGEVPEDFELIDTKANEDDIVNPICLAGWG